MAGQSSTYIGGAPDTTSYVHVTSIIPSQGPIQEFNVVTNNLTADYGGLAGGAMRLSSSIATGIGEADLLSALRTTPSSLRIL